MSDIVKRRSDGKFFKASYPPDWDDGDAMAALFGGGRPFFYIGRPFYFIPVERAPWWQFWRRWRPTGGPAWTDAGPADFDRVK